MTTRTGGRPRRLVVVVGTATEVGKTWAAGEVAVEARRAGLTVAARKPVQSFEADDTGAPRTPTDAELLAAATGEPIPDVCRLDRWYPVPMAPPMAADMLQRGQIALDDLAAELAWPPGTDLGLVETAGGVRSPLTHDLVGGDSAGLAHRLAPDVILLVADAALGTINATRLSAATMAPLPVVVLLNRYDADDELHRRNRAWLADRDGFDVIVGPGDLLARLP